MGRSGCPKEDYRNGICVVSGWKLHTIPTLDPHLQLACRPIYSNISMFIDLRLTCPEYMTYHSIECLFKMIDVQASSVLKYSAETWAINKGLVIDRVHTQTMNI